MGGLGKTPNYVACSDVTTNIFSPFINLKKVFLQINSFIGKIKYTFLFMCLNVTGGIFESNGTTSVPKSIPFLLAKSYSFFVGLLTRVNHDNLMISYRVARK